jgi:cell division protein FtsQ
MRRVTKQETRRTPVRRRAPRRTPRLTIALSAAASAFVIGLGGWLLWPTAWLDAQKTALIDDVLALTADLGLRIERVTVEGRKETPTELLISTIEVDTGDPILAIDAEELRLRLADLPWVRNAVVERRLPNELRLIIEEREPVALWQRDNRYHLIDQYGDTMAVADVSRYAGMLVLTGSDAPANAHALFDLLALEPELATRVVAAQRIGSRRWNLKLDNGVDIRLPEEEPAAAWHALAEMQRDEGLVDRDLVMIDMRVPDRLIVRLSPDAAELRRTPGDDT